MGLGVDGIDGEDGLGIPGPAGTGTSGASLLGLVAPSSLSVPSLGSFTWGNQGDATATANAGGGLWFEASGVQQDIRFLYVAASGSFTAICGYMDGNVSPLVALRESSSGKLIGADASNGAGANVLGIFKYNSYTSFNANYISNSSAPASIFKFWKITSNGTVYTWYWSVDGQSWEQYLQKNVNDFFTTAADQIGMAINPNNASIRTGLLWVYWSLA